MGNVRAEHFERRRSDIIRTLYAHASLTAASSERGCNTRGLLTYILPVLSSGIKVADKDISLTYCIYVLPFFA